MPQAAAVQRAVRRGSGKSSLPRTIWYMGAKGRVLSGFLDQVLLEEVSAGGTVVDLMSGSGVVAAFCARHFRIFANDVQRYSQVLAKSLIDHDPDTKPRVLESLDPETDLRAAFDQNRKELEAAYAPALAVEAKLLEEFTRVKARRHASSERGRRWARKYRDFLQLDGGVHGSSPAAPLYRSCRHLVSGEAIAAYRADPSRQPGCLVTSYFANIYYGLRQAIAIDSLRVAIRSLAPALFAPREILERKRTHYLAALLCAASVSTSGTSHFAQPRHLEKDRELRAMAERRRIDIWQMFLLVSQELAGHVEATAHRPGNLALARSYRDFLVPDSGGAEKFEFPAPVDLVYMDPPYTADNYSRFYHVLESLVTYDYPELDRDRTGKILRGRYPAGRFQSGFCGRGTVEDEFRRVILAAARGGTKLVISYASPTGLLLKKYRQDDPACRPLERFQSLAREGFRRVRLCRKNFMHSGQGDSNLQIEELLLVCSGPRT